MLSNTLPRLLSLTSTFISHDSKPWGAVPGILFSLNHRELDPTHQIVLNVLKNKTTSSLRKAASSHIWRYIYIHIYIYICSFFYSKTVRLLSDFLKSHNLLMLYWSEISMYFLCKIWDKLKEIKVIFFIRRGKF